MSECPSCGMRDDDWFLCRRENCATKAVPADTIASLTARIAALEAALRDAKQTMRNSRGAIESNQVEDKDVRRQLTRGMERIDAAIHPSPDDRAKVDIAEEWARIAGGVAKENDTGSGFDSQVAYTTARRIERDIRARFGRPA